MQAAAKAGWTETRTGVRTAAADLALWRKAAGKADKCSRSRSPERIEHLHNLKETILKKAVVIISNEAICESDVKDG